MSNSQEVRNMRVCVLWQLFLFRSHATARVGSLTRAFFTTLKPSSGSPHRTANVPINFSRLVSFATEPYRGVSHLERFAVAFHLQHVAEEKCSKLAKISKNIPRKNYENREKLKRRDSGSSRDIKSFAEFGMWSNSRVGSTMRSIFGVEILNLPAYWTMTLIGEGLRRCGGFGGSGRRRLGVRGTHKSTNIRRFGLRRGRPLVRASILLACSLMNSICTPSAKAVSGCRPDPWRLVNVALPTPLGVPSADCRPALWQAKRERAR